jgi:hypothetical protein
VIGLGVAGLAVVLLVLDQTTDLPVPYGYDGSGFRFLIGGVVALLVVIVLGWQYRDIFLSNSLGKQLAFAQSVAGLVQLLSQLVLSRFAIVAI